MKDNMIICYKVLFDPFGVQFLMNYSAIRTYFK